MTSKLRKIVAEIEGLSPAERETVRKHLAGGKNARKKVENTQTLTNGRSNGYNPRRMVTTIPRTDLSDHVGRRIAERRHALGLSQEDLAKRVGMGRVSIARIETGARTPHKTTVRCIALALDTASEDLLPNA